MRRTNDDEYDGEVEYPTDDLRDAAADAELHDIMDNFADYGEEARRTNNAKKWRVRRRDIKSEYE